ncbi:hypothetical protein TWF281_011687 [Arthrobotrys megalospora]
MEKQLPFPYKLVIIRKEREEWVLAHVSTFDCAEPPVPGLDGINLKDSLFQLGNYSTASLVFIHSVIEKINASPALEGTGCRYCIFGADTARYDDSWDKICIVLKLANSNDAFRAAVGKPAVDRDEEPIMLRCSGPQTPASSVTHTL